MSSHICCLLFGAAVFEHGKREVHCVVLWVAETVRTRGLSSPTQHSIALISTGKLANLPVPEPIYISSLPCFKGTEILLGSRFCAFLLCVSSWACLRFTFTCPLEPLRVMHLPWTTPVASAVGVPPLWLGFFLLLLPGTLPGAKAACSCAEG